MYTCTCTDIYIYVYIYIYIHIAIYTYTYIYMYVSTLIHFALPHTPFPFCTLTQKLINVLPIYIEIFVYLLFT